METNLLYYGDNLDVLRRHVRDESIDLVYLDPPFKSDVDYNVLFAEHGEKSAAQIKAFTDTWEWNTDAAAAYQEVVEGGGEVAKAMLAFRTLLGTSDMLAYLSMMAPRLIELQRKLKASGSLYLHCDTAASHYLKLLLDTVFGPDNFRNEIIWRRTGAHSPPRRFGPIHQSIMFYSKTKQYYFKPIKRPYMRGHVKSRYTEDAEGRAKFTSGGNVLTGAGKSGGDSGKAWRGFDPSAKHRHWAVPGFLAAQMPDGFGDLDLLAKLDALYDAGLIDIEEGNAWPTPVRFLTPESGQVVQDIWAYQPYTEGTVYGTEEGIDADVKWLGPKGGERMYYPTQKPVGLLARIISASCPADGIVLDPFCGCGTAVDAAQALGRSWVGIDITHLSIGLIKHRLADRYGPTITKTYRVVGEPTTAEDAKVLAKEDPFQFQAWALGLVGARVASSDKKGGDKGVDGRLYFHDSVNGPSRQIVFSVKAGKLVPAFVRELDTVRRQQGADIGVLVTFEQPTSGMRTEAAGFDFYESPWGSHPRIQLRTVAELLEGKGVDYPHVTGSNVTLRRRSQRTERADVLPLFDEAARD